LANKWNLKNLPSPEVQITKLKLSPTPQFNVFGGCGKLDLFIKNYHNLIEPWFLIQNDQITYDSRVTF